MEPGERMANRLIGEKSPYLLQHAYNPVAWYPWGAEAFERAKMEDKPIFLSIGYSTCHWCHVMEEESFENEMIAGIMNREFISVKVDREERPDVDSVYMAVCQAMTGQGGWPLTIIMTPECRPFFAGTYLPPVRRYGRMGLQELLTSVAKQWKEKRQQLVGNAEHIQNFLRQQAEQEEEGEPSRGLTDRGYRQLERSFDGEYGGFGGAPKFPTPHHLLFLMDYGAREKAPEAFYMVERTLEQMYRGGIFDHIGGGFSRYSTDERWLVPHFEKMLYDNALLTLAYVGAYGVTGNRLYADVAGRILGYVERELTDVDGGFYCGQDADSDGVEGKYYVFTPEEIWAVLGDEKGEMFCRTYGITEEGNFEGKSIPNLLGDEWENAGAGGEEIQKLYEYRLARTRLHKDDKILVSWNGWMIAACARAGAVLKEDRYVEMAVRAEAFIRNRLWKDGRLMVRYRDGDSAGEGKLEDYACYCLALVELYEVTYEVDYLSRACEIAETMVRQFFDEKRGGFYLYAEDGEALIVRTKETYDGAMPSGNSVAARVLELLSRLTGGTWWQEGLDKQMRFLAGAMEGYPAGSSYGLLAMMNVLYPTKELVCVCSEGVVGGSSEEVVGGSLEEVVGGSSEEVVGGSLEEVVGGSLEKVVIGSSEEVVIGSLEEQVRENSKKLVSEKEVKLLCQEQTWKHQIREIARLAGTVPGLVVVVKTVVNERKLGELAPYTKDYPIPETGAEFYLCTGRQCMQPVAELKQVMKMLEE